MSIRVVVADDHEIIREGLIAQLSGTEVEVIGLASDGETAVQMALERSPDVLLLDVRMPGLDGLEALARVKGGQPEQVVLMMSSYDNPGYAAKAVSLGASGYLLKDAPRDELLAALRRVALGQDLWSREKLRRVSGSIASLGEPIQPEVTFTKREKDVLQLLANGQTNREIAERLEISAETVKEHVKHLLTKIGVADRTQAAVWAVRNGMI
jgi:DNA-binding NarL/FixJ family response regulator